VTQLCGVLDVVPRDLAKQVSTQKRHLAPYVRQTPVRRGEDDIIARVPEHSENPHADAVLEVLFP
jgi:hypothetical protein